MSATFVGFGFGPINAGLFLLEAWRSNRFDRLVVAEIDAGAVEALRAAGGAYAVNVAQAAGRTVERVEGIEILNPTIPADAERLMEALAHAQEISTALPSPRVFSLGAPSVADLLARALDLRRAQCPDAPVVIYAGENDADAAGRLAEAVAARRKTPAGGEPVRFLNTVIGKMSGTVTDSDPGGLGELQPVTPGAPRAFLVEAFNRILISAIGLPGFSRGLDRFIEKPDLQPFEEAKLYGHNATHALLGYLAEEKGLAIMAETAGDSELMAQIREAFIEESGGALRARFAGVDPLFTPDGYRAYAEDLIARMTNPWLVDRVARITRDPVRKLGWDDRLIGVMRRALDVGIRPRRYAQGAAAALRRLRAEQPERAGERLWETLWPEPDEPAGRKAELRKMMEGPVEQA